MAIPSSGTIGVSQHLNRELGRGISSTFSIDTAENGGYGAINTNSSSRPSSANPASFSEWYGYDHDAGGGGTPVTRLNFGYDSRNSFQGGADACAGRARMLAYTSNADSWWTVPLYGNGQQSRYAVRGMYSDQPLGTGYTYAWWTGNSWNEASLCVI